ncbi:hypothetical protein E3N88_12102 [Mikania micrantha]|uniref:HAT C-terminal dimerisation domain-containing protein n=1 Tax=Mikania micrantha TaxID=192012 RepID=A0A5N6P6J3_9ASTR|nr:hypothetical protein E3N88_12102 [Mikania micrantha]
MNQRSFEKIGFCVCDHETQHLADPYITKLSFAPSTTLPDVRITWIVVWSRRFDEEDDASNRFDGQKLQPPLTNPRGVPRTIMTRCKGCGTFLKPESNSTLRSHLTKHCVVVKNNPANDQAQMSQECGVWNFDPDMVGEMMGNLVIQESLPFNHFDNPRLTKVIQKALQPRYHQESQFPIISAMARDLLSVQASTVASESTMLTPTLLEMCICLKDHLDAMERVQNHTLLEGELEIKETIHDVEVEEGMTFPLSDKEQAMDEWMRTNSQALQSEAQTED